MLYHRHTLSSHCTGFWGYEQALVSTASGGLMQGGEEGRGREIMGKVRGIIEQGHSRSPDQPYL